jgi:hypothetical protein
MALSSCFVLDNYSYGFVSCIFHDDRYENSIKLTPSDNMRVTRAKTASVIRDEFEGSR